MGGVQCQLSLNCCSVLCGHELCLTRLLRFQSGFIVSRASSSTPIKIKYNLPEEDAQLLSTEVADINSEEMEINEAE